MPIIEFDNGQKVEFDKDPSPQDIEFAAKRLGITAKVPEKASEPAQQKLSLYEQMVRGPGRDLAAGYLKGASKVVTPAARILEFIRVKDENNIFKQSEEMHKNLLRNLPPQTTGKTAGFINQLISETPGLLSEFQQGSGILKAAKIPQALSKIPAGTKLLPAAEFALVSAIENLNQSFPKALEAAQSGALVGMAFPVAGKGLEMLKLGFKEGAKKLITFATNRPKLAEDFVKNPFKYAVRFIDKNVETLKQAKIENKRISDELRFRHQREIESFRETQRESANEFIRKQKEIETSVRDKMSDLKNKIQKSGETSINEIRESSLNALNEQRASLSGAINKDIENTFRSVELLKKQEGEQVANAVGELVALDPTSHIAYKIVKDRVMNVLNNQAKKGAFRLEKGVVKPVSSGQESQTRIINRFLEDLNKRAPRTRKIEFMTPFQPAVTTTSGGKVELDLLQSMKNDAREIASMSFQRGRNSLGATMNDLSKVLDPAKIVTDNPILQKKLGRLSQVNKAFAEKIRPYKELVDLMAKTDANGKIVVDPSRVINGVRNNIVQIVKRLREIDSKLAPEEQMLPKIRKYNEAINKAVSDQKSLVKQAKRNVSMELQKVSESTKNILSQTQTTQRQKRFGYFQNQRANLLEQRRTRQEELMSTKRMLDDEIEFLESESALSSFQGVGLSGLIQRLFAFGGVVPSIFSASLNPGGLVLGAAGAASLSPNILARIVQTARRTELAAGRVSDSISRRSKEEIISLVQRKIASMNSNTR